MVTKAWIMVNLYPLESAQEMTTKMDLIKVNIPMCGTFSTFNDGESKLLIRGCNMKGVKVYKLDRDKEITLQQYVQQ